MSTPGDATPGRFTPGLRTPQLDYRGHRAPGDAEPTTVSATGVAVDATGTTNLGTVDGDRDLTLEVRVNATAADFNFQVSVGGENVFSSAQSPSGTTEEAFYPALTLAAITSATDEDVVFEVTSVSGTGGATTDVDVDLVSDDMT